MQAFFEIAKTDFSAAFEGAWIFPMLLAAVLCTLRMERSREKRLLFGVLPLIFLFLYWFPLTGMVLMRILGENVYWRLLWLIVPALVIPYACCLVLRKMKEVYRQLVFALMLLTIMLGGKRVLSTEWFEPSVNVYKIPQYVIEVCELLPENVHVLASNRLTPYLRLHDPTLTLEYARNALVFNGMDEVYGPVANLYKAVQEAEIDVDVVGPLAREEACTFLIFSASRTYSGDWSEYGYREYAGTDEFRIFVDENYEEGQDTRKWEE